LAWPKARVTHVRAQSKSKFGCLTHAQTSNDSAGKAQIRDMFGTKSEIDPNSGAHRRVKPHADASIAIVLARSWSDLYVCLSAPLFSNDAVCVRMKIHEQRGSSLVQYKALCDNGPTRNIRG